jgi:hypothetical protein
MKFHQLTVGTQFEFKGKRCIKTNEVMASDVETGKPVFMKRSAEVELKDELEEQRQAALNQAQQILHDALVAYRQSCLETVRQALPDAEPKWLSQLNDKLEQSRIQLFRQMSERLG